MKRVLILIHDLAVGGVATSLVNVTRVLCNHGCDITVRTTSTKVDKAVLARIDNRVKVEICDEKRFLLLEKLPYVRNFFESGCWTTRHSARRVYRHFVPKNEKDIYDVEMAFYFGRPVKAISGSTNERSKKIMWLRSAIMDNSSFPAFSRVEDALAAFRSFDKIIGVSEDVAENFVKQTGVDGGRVTVIHNFLDKKNIDACLKEPCPLEKKCFTFACVCRFSPMKNLMTLLAVIKRLQREGFACGCWLVGDGPMRAEMETYIRENGLQNVVITGFQKNPHKYVKAADLYVFPSLQEGYPNTLADSMYIGTPIVSTRCVGAPNILADGKYGILTDFSEDSLYDGVRRMMTDTALYRHYQTVLAEHDFDKDALEIERKLVEAVMESC